MRFLPCAGAATALLLASCALFPFAGCSEGDGSSGIPGPGPGSGGGFANAAPPDEAPVEPADPDAGPDLDAGVPASTYYLQLSSDDSTSMASAQMAKAGVQGPLHRHEILNYYDPPAALFAEEPWAITASPSSGVELGLEAVTGPTLESDAGSTGTLELLFEMRAAPVDPEARRPWHLVYCVDVSGSMSGEKIAFVRDALARSLDHLRAGDTLTLVTFESTAHTVFVERSWPEDEAAIRADFAALAPLGATDMMAGLSRAYELAQAAHEGSRLSRVLLFGDGIANVGDTEIAEFAALTRIENEAGIFLSSVGVGYDFDWTRMDRLADAGKGASVFLPSAAEVERIFGADFPKLVEVAASDVMIELRVPVGLRLLDFTGEEVSLDPDAPVPSIVLAAGDDFTFLVRFAVDDPAALSVPTSLRVGYRLLGTDEEIVHVADVASFADLLRAPGALHARTRIVDDYARRVVGDPAGPDATAIVAAIDALGLTDPGLAEVRALLAP